MKSRKTNQDGGEFELKDTSSPPPTKKYKWHKENDVIVCEVHGKNSIEEFRNYAKMIVEMTSAGWEPWGWKYGEELKF